MTIKEQVLKALTVKNQEYISGEKLSKELFCSRNAVWKAIKSLEADGYIIDAVTNKGYRLSAQNDVFCAESVQKFIKNENCRVKVLDKVDSTNNYLKKLAENGENEWTVVIANEQTFGKGRLGRSFFSPYNGLYMSILLRPSVSAQRSLFITTAAAVAVSEAIEELSGKATGIKWVNDIFIGDKKVCGILTEASIDFETGGLYYAVLGIGVNVFAPRGGFPDELKSIAGAVFDNSHNEKEVKQRLCAQIINNFSDIYNDFDNNGFMAKYREKSNVIGKKIFVLNKDKKRQATAVDIDSQARLIVKYEDGEVETLSSGEVSVRL